MWCVYAYVRVIHACMHVGMSACMCITPGNAMWCDASK